MRDQKTPMARTLPLSGQRSALREIQLRGRSLPCHVVAIAGSIVTVAFDVADSPLPQAQMPVVGAEYIRMPIQLDCKGVCRPSSVDIGIVTGLGPANSLPDLNVLPGNLSALVFEPVGNANWTASPNPTALVCYGAGGGVILQDIAGSSPNWSVTVNSSGMTIKGAGKTWTFNSDGFTWSTGIVAETHGHSPGTYVAGDTNVTGQSGEPVAE